MASLLVAAGLALFLWSVREIGWRRTCGLTNEPRHPEEPRLVLGGPFRIVRHPVALAAILVLVGSALALRSTAVALGVGAALAFIALAARRSESVLAERFGDVYRRYQGAVPFLLPRPRSMRRRNDP